MDLEQRLLQASENGEASTVRKLLRHRANPNAQDDRGDSALSKASRGRALQCTLTLLHTQKSG